MKKIFSFALLLCCFTSFSQSIGIKKEIVLRLYSYSCGDNCYIKFKDDVKGTVYDFHNIDGKTKDNNNLKEIQDSYYASGESENFKLIGQVYSATIEYRTTKEFNEGFEGREYTGKVIKKWMINSLKKIVLKAPTTKQIGTITSVDAGGSHLMYIDLKVGTSTKTIGLSSVSPVTEQTAENTTQVYDQNGRERYWTALKKGMRVEVSLKSGETRTTEGNIYWAKSIKIIR